LIKIIDTPQFQRLRDIKQLGCTYRVFPGASHNRFEHAIGACHLAGELVQVIMNLQKGAFAGGEPIVTPVDALCVKIAALCYNLGYGPFSHVFDEMCAEKEISGWSVEKASVVMFQYLINADENKKLKKSLGDLNVNDAELRFIEALIDQSLPLPEEMERKAFLRKVVRDPETSIDAVTMDSIARDSYLLNIPSSFDHKRLVKFVRLNKKRGSEEYVLCYREIEAHDLYSMFLSRLSLQTKAYKHKTVQLLEWMLRQALEKADEVLELTETARGLLSSEEAVRKAAAVKYTRLTDYVMDRIMESGEPSLRESKEMWADVQHRKLFKFIGTVQTVSTGQDPDTQTFQSKLRQLQSDASQRFLEKLCNVDRQVQLWNRAA
jgi:HD superfamily phosphohydrolase